MRVLLVGDIVGKPGRNAFTKVAAQMKSEGRVDFIIANGENAAAGRGPTPEMANALIGAGADVVTLGDHAWDAKEMVAGIDLEERIIRPANFPKGSPGKGFVRVDTPEGPLTVVQLVGRVFMQPSYDCPFQTVDRMLKGMLSSDKAIFVDFHGEASSERMAMGRFLDGRVSAVFGTHTHCQTSDETVFDNGTAYITDLGMTGPKDSVLGREVEPVLAKFLTGVPHKFEVAKGKPTLEGALVDVDMKTGKAEAIERIRIEV
ncbi:TIGR00282 family metallophosphoesterase [Pontiella sp.]|uniref:TIGR00282 family metallophosphoesterase n=1 Tax=Pontiella sp. TaxID=2837462 RepID=UPI0035657619